MPGVTGERELMFARGVYVVVLIIFHVWKQRCGTFKVWMNGKSEEDFSFYDKLHPTWVSTQVTPPSSSAPPPPQASLPETRSPSRAVDL